VVAAAVVCAATGCTYAVRKSEMVVNAPIAGPPVADVGYLTVDVDAAALDDAGRYRRLEPAVFKEAVAQSLLASRFFASLAPSPDDATHVLSVRVTAIVAGVSPSKPGADDVQIGADWRLTENASGTVLVYKSIRGECALGVGDVFVGTERFRSETEGAAKANIAAALKELPRALALRTKKLAEAR
jgi:hypothetical protein